MGLSGNGEEVPVREKGWDRGVPDLTVAAKDGRTLDNSVLE